MKLFVNTKTKECGVYDPQDLDDENWVEAPKGTQAVYWSGMGKKPLFYRVKGGCLYLYSRAFNGWANSNVTVECLIKNKRLQHLYGTLQDFEF